MPLKSNLPNFFKSIECLKRFHKKYIKFALFRWGALNISTNITFEPIRRKDFDETFVLKLLNDLINLCAPNLLSKIPIAVRTFNFMHYKFCINNILLLTMDKLPRRIELSVHLIITRFRFGLILCHLLFYCSNHFQLYILL